MQSSVNCFSSAADVQGNKESSQFSSEVLDTQVNIELISVLFIFKSSPVLMNTKTFTSLPLFTQTLHFKY